MKCLSESRVVAWKAESYQDLQLPESFRNLFSCIQPGDRVVLKPNWVRASHMYKPEEWESVITHPAVIQAVLSEVIARLGGSGEIRIIDGPHFDTRYEELISHYPVEEWKKLAIGEGIRLEVIDLRDEEQHFRNDIMVKRAKLEGDPRGSVEFNLVGENSEFHGQVKSPRGYYGAFYDIEETNRAHDGTNNLYRVSRSVIDSDVFINLPKLKTHKKGGITCCLKNLVGINTYRNFLPHHMEGHPSEGGDQFPPATQAGKLEGPLVAWLKKNLFIHPSLAFISIPLKLMGRMVFGHTDTTIRSGNWYGNDTIWRTILDLNKILLYGNPDGSMRSDNPEMAKRYIGIVDGIIAGEGNGPMAPDAVQMGYLFGGNNPVAIDAACAAMMGFDPMRLPSVKKAFDIRHYPVTGFPADEMKISVGQEEYSLFSLPEDKITRFVPHLGWRNYLEKQPAAR